MKYCFQLGYILKTHGLKGDLILIIDAYNFEDYTKIESVFIEINEKLIPFFITDIKPNGTKFIIKFEDIDTVEEARDFKGVAVYLPLSSLTPLKEGYYFHELIGLQVDDRQLGQLGVISSIYNREIQHLLEMDYQGKKILIPLINDIILRVDKKNKTIYTSLPDGLLEVYLLGDED